MLSLLPSQVENEKGHCLNQTKQSHNPTHLQQTKPKKAIVLRLQNSLAKQNSLPWSPASRDLIHSMSNWPVLPYLLDNKSISREVKVMTFNP